MQRMTHRDRASHRESIRRAGKGEEDFIIERIDFLKQFGEWYKELKIAATQRNVKQIGRLFKEANAMKKAIKACEAFELRDIKALCTAIDDAKVDFVPPPRPDGEIGSITLTVTRPAEIEDEPQLQIEHHSG